MTRGSERVSWMIYRREMQLTYEYIHIVLMDFLMQLDISLFPLITFVTSSSNI